jgi:hypothetical protein
VATNSEVVENVTEASISVAPLIGLFGSKAAYQVLMYLENYGSGYAAEIARTFGMSLSQAQNQLRKFEELGLFVSRREAAGIVATLSGGSAVSIYTDNRYQSADLDFVTTALLAELKPVLEPLGFERRPRCRSSRTTTSSPEAPG